MYKLFISYKRDDNADGFVKKLYDRLMEAGYDVWWDMESLLNRGVHFPVEIRDAIYNCDRLILVGSKAAYQSEWVKREYEYALSICKPVNLLMRADDYPDIPESLRDYDTPDFRNDDEFEKSFAHLQRHLDEEAAPLAEIHGDRPALPAWHIDRDDVMKALTAQAMIGVQQAAGIRGKQQIQALFGMGGMGKTTVASAFCERCDVRRSFPDGIFWLGCGKNPDISSLQAKIGEVFKDDPQEYLSPAEGLTRLNNLLSDKKVLIVLDDVWEKEHVEFFRIQGEFARLLITTRQHDIATQLGAISSEVDKLSVKEGLRLFDTRLNREPDTAQHADVEQEIIELLDGYTLAVELASAELAKKGQGFAPALLKLLQKKRETDNPFSELVIEGGGKNTNLEISLAISYEDLSEDEQYRFRVLGILAPDASFSCDLMQALYRDDDYSLTMNKLDALENMALLGYTKSGDYIQHSVLRDYARALLKRENEYNNSLRDYIAHCVTQSDQLAALGAHEWHDLEADIPHIHYTGDYLAAHYEDDTDLHAAALQFADNVKEYLLYRRELPREDWLLMGLSLAQQNEDAKRQGEFLDELGLMASAFGEKQKALEYFEKALEFRREAKHFNAVAQTLNNLGSVHDELGEKQKALEHFEAALTQVENTTTRGTILNNMGETYRTLGDNETALDYYQQALPLIHDAQDFRTEAILLNNMGMVYANLGATDEAIEHFNQSLPVAREIRDKSLEAHVLNNIGFAYFRTQQYEQAMEFYEQALPIHRITGNAPMEAVTLNNIGKIYQEHYEDWSQALEYYNPALELVQRVGHRFFEYHILQNIAMIRYRQDKLSEAIDCLEAVIAIGEDLEVPTLDKTRELFTNWTQERDG